MTKTPHFPRVIFPGASGRLGRLLQGAYTADRDAYGPAIFAARDGSADVQINADSPMSAAPPADVVVALWGVTSGSEQQLERNVELVQASTALARRVGARVVLHLSSAGVYGPGAALEETAPLAPASPYGQSKLRMEQAVAQLEDDTLSHCCLRLANVVGADSLAPALNTQADAPMRLTRFDNGRGPKRSYISPGHLLHILFAISRLPAQRLPGTLNIAAACAIEMEALGRAAGKVIEWKPVEPQDRQEVTLSTTRLARLLPDTPLHKSADDMIADWIQAEAHQ